jgi:hypothetical protein
VLEFPTPCKIREKDRFTMSLIIIIGFGLQTARKIFRGHIYCLQSISGTLSMASHDVTATVTVVATIPPQFPPPFICLVLQLCIYSNYHLPYCNIPKYPLWQACDALYFFDAQIATSHPAPSHKLMQPIQEPSNQSDE